MREKYEKLQKRQGNKRSVEERGKIKNKEYINVENQKNNMKCL